MRDVGLAGRGEHAKCRRKGGDRRNNRHQSGSSGAAAGRTLSPESLDPAAAAGLGCIFLTLLHLKTLWDLGVQKYVYTYPCCLTDSQTAT